MKTDEEIIEEIIRSAIVSIPEKYLPRVEDTIDFYNKFSPALIKLANDCFKHARESEREKTRTETAKEIFEKLENAFETILGYDAKGEDVLCWENFVKVRDAILINKKETETKVKE